MYEIAFNFSDRSEEYKSKAGKILSPLPYGRILERILKTENNSDIDNLLTDFDCSELINIYTDVPELGDIKRVPSRDKYTTVHNEKLSLSYALNEYIRVEKSILRNSKVKNTQAQREKPEIITVNRPYVEEIFSDEGTLMERRAVEKKHNLEVFPGYLKASKISVSFMEAAWALNRQVAERLNGISINLSPLCMKKENFMSVEFALKYSSNDFLSLPWLELLMIVKDNAKIRTCETCGYYYFNAKKNSRSVCTGCEPKSRNPSERTNEVKERNAIIRQIQRGKLSIDNGNAILRSKGMKVYKPSSNKRESE